MSGSALLRLDAVETLIAGTAKFQTKVGAADATAAKSRIYYGEQGVIAELVPGKTLKSERPGVILCLDRHGYVQIGEGAQITLGGTGAVCAIFMDNAAAGTHKASMRAFLDWVSTVIDQLAEVVGRGDNWPVIGVEMLVEPWRSDPASRKSDDFWLMAYLFSDHINGGGS